MLGWVLAGAMRFGWILGASLSTLRASPSGETLASLGVGGLVLWGWKAGTVACHVCARTTKGRKGEVGGEDRWPGSGGWDIFKFKVEEYILIC